MSEYKIIDRNDPWLQSIEAYKLILDTECHHDHPIIEDEFGVVRWLPGEESVQFEAGNLDLNSVISDMRSKGLSKNSEEYRLLFRNLGYSLSGYYDVFYWDVNNEEAEEYRPPVEDSQLLLFSGGENG